jgi:hypothetical protein
MRLGVAAPAGRGVPMVAKVMIQFAEHVSADRVAGMVSSIAAYGNVVDGGSPKEFVVEIFRVSHLPGLKTRLMEWERYGFLTYAEPPISN